MIPLPKLSRCLQHSSFRRIADGTTKHSLSATRLLNQLCITRSLGGGLAQEVHKYYASSATVLHDVNNNSRFRYGFYANRIRK